ncbi:MAG: platelet-activating factor acetylhydrolase IB subunit [Opitutaceae bacterium]|nr:platelet-activating factor acetylhydrolase IB subunit [Opitutaceae bacterium]
MLAPAILWIAATLAQAEPATEPRPRDAGWVKRHEEFVALAKQGGVEVLFVGDSITDFWRREDKKSGGKKIWDQHFAPLKAANFGISGDRTQHVLWRLENGELEGISPKVVVLMIGTNNTGFERDGKTVRNTPAETAEGVTAIVKKLRTALPQAKILLLGIFPRGEKPDHPQRRQIAEINAVIAKLADRKTVHYLDLGPRFLTATGALPKEFMPDFLHPGELGYEIWADAIKAPLAELLK